MKLIELPTTVGGDRGSVVSAAVAGGKVVVAGHFARLNPDTTESTDLFLAQFDGAGHQEWLTVFGTPASDSATEVALDAEGSVYVAGFTYGESLDGIANAGDSDVFVSKYSAAGQRVWTSLVGTAGQEISGGLAVGKDGSIYVAGYTSQGLDGATNLRGKDGSGPEDAFVARLDADGNKLWSRQLGSEHSDTVQGVSVDSNGDIYVLTTTESPTWIGKFGWQWGGVDVVHHVAKYKPSGKRDWNRAFSRKPVYRLPCTYRVSGLAIDAQDRIFVAGARDLNCSAKAQVYVQEFTQSGWDKGLRKYDNDRFLVPSDLAVDTSRATLYFFGSTFSTDPASQVDGMPTQDLFLLSAKTF
jgi:hypothetical protein